MRIKARENGYRWLHLAHEIDFQFFFDNFHIRLINSMYRIPGNLFQGMPGSNTQFGYFFTAHRCIPNIVWLTNTAVNMLAAIPIQRVMAKPLMGPVPKLNNTMAAMKVVIFASTMVRKLLKNHFQLPYARLHLPVPLRGCAQRPTHWHRWPCPLSK